MPLTIKDDDARTLARAKARAEELLEIGRRCAARLKEPAMDHADLLYDERGLPK